MRLDSRKLKCDPVFFSDSAKGMWGDSLVVFHPHYCRGSNVKSAPTIEEGGAAGFHVRGSEDSGALNPRVSADHMQDGTVFIPEQVYRSFHD